MLQFPLEMASPALGVMLVECILSLVPGHESCRGFSQLLCDLLSVYERPVFHVTWPLKIRFVRIIMSRIPCC